MSKNFEVLFIWRCSSFYKFFG